MFDSEQIKHPRYWKCERTPLCITPICAIEEKLLPASEEGDSDVELSEDDSDVELLEEAGGGDEVEEVDNEL